MLIGNTPNSASLALASSAVILFLRSACSSTFETSSSQSAGLLHQSFLLGLVIEPFAKPVDKC